MAMADARIIIARRAAQEVKEGMVVNLGIGIPGLIPDFLPAGFQVWFQAENGVLGMGPTPSMPDPSLINAGGAVVSVIPGASYFDSAVSFGMIRNGSIDMAVMGALQVSASGDIANWIVPGKRVPGVGGAMDLAYGASILVAVMTHTEKDGSPKILQHCILPLTARQRVKKIITELAVFSVTTDGLVLEEIMEGSSLEEIRKKTAADFMVNKSIPV